MSPTILTTLDDVHAQEPETVLRSATGIVYTLANKAPLWDRPGRRNGTCAEYIELPATVLYSPGTPTAADQLRDALEAAGLPADETVASLIRHHRGNAALAAALSTLTAVPTTSATATREDVARAALAADTTLTSPPAWHEERRTPRWLQALGVADAVLALPGLRDEAAVRCEHLDAVILVLTNALALSQAHDLIAPDEAAGWLTAIRNLETMQRSRSTHT